MKMPGFLSMTQGFGSESRFIMVMLSNPPPMAASAPPRMIWWAAMAMAWSPEEQKRFTVVAATDAGNPTRSVATRATLLPCGPLGWAQPRITSSISAESSWGTLPSTSRMQWAARSSGRVRLNDPQKDLASGVRELATTTASLIAWLLSKTLSDAMSRVYAIAGRGVGLCAGYPSPSCGAGPPSMMMVAPVMKEEASEARKMQG